MSEYVAVAILTAIATMASSAYFISRNLRRDLRRLHEYEFFCDKFFRAADILVAEPDTPERMLNSLELLNCIINDEQMAKRLFKIYYRLGRQQIEEGKSETIPELVTFLSAHKNIEKVVIEAFMSGILATTFLNNRWGLRYRAMLADLYAREVKPLTAIRAIEESRKQAPAALAEAAAA